MIITGTPSPSCVFDDLPMCGCVRRSREPLHLSDVLPGYSDLLRQNDLLHFRSVLWWFCCCRYETLLFGQTWMRQFMFKIYRKELRYHGMCTHCLISGLLWAIGDFEDLPDFAPPTFEDFNVIRVSTLCHRDYIFNRLTEIWIMEIKRYF